jgi:hypothetical protein
MFAMGTISACFKHLKDAPVVVRILYAYTTTTENEDIMNDYNFGFYPCVRNSDHHWWMQTGHITYILGC